MKTLSINARVFQRFFTLLCVFFSGTWIFAQTVISPDGFAAYAGTTGGGNATPITVSSASAFKSAVSGSSPAVIYVDGFLNVGNVSIGSNKTIIGKTTSSGLGGGRVSVNGSNYIFQNLIFGPGSTDVMEISGGTKVFITKCAFHDAGDELLSIVREADYVTVSWCKFYFNNSHDHAFGHLIGNSDTRITDRGKLHVTMHHNYYANGVVGRMPRVRFGQVHLYNNYYNCSGNSYCVGVGFECHIRIENVHFENINGPWADYGGTSNGQIGWTGLKFDGCSQPTFVKNSYPVFNPPYSFSVDPVNNVKATVKAGAGNVFGGNTNPPTNTPVTGVSVKPTSVSVNAGSTTQLTATVTPSNATNKTVSWKSSNTSVATVNSSGLVSGVAAGSATITVTTADKGFTASCTVTVTGSSSGGGCSNPVSITVPFSKDGVGEFCWKTSSDISSVNSWNLEKLTINGVDFKNTYSSSLPAKQGGYYYIEYVGLYGWSHMEIASARSVNGMLSSLGEEVYLYPNPAGEVVNIHIASDLNETVQIQLMDMSGKALKSIYTADNNNVLDLSAFPKGVYILKVSGESLNVQKRIIKQ